MGGILIVDVDIKFDYHNEKKIMIKLSGVNGG